jgi:hypothetical protein
MHEAQVKNIVQEQIQDLETRRSVVGCASKVGCVKGKELDNFVNGIYSSDKNDIFQFIKKQDAINEIMGNKFTEAMHMLQNVLGEIGVLVKTISAQDKRIEAEALKTEKNIAKIDGRLWSTFAAIVIACILTVWGVWKVQNNVGKINSVDINNQFRTEAYLATLATMLSDKTTEQILAEHSEKMKALLEKGKK